MSTGPRQYDPRSTGLGPELSTTPVFFSDAVITSEYCLAGRRQKSPCRSVAGTFSAHSGNACRWLPPSPMT